MMDVGSRADLRQVWDERYRVAYSFMEERAGVARTLVEIAAQHPLRDGLRPNDEFQKRLDRGIEVFNSYRASGHHVEVYVPGSRHAFEGRADRISLSDAGCAYLIERGVPAPLVHGDDLNRRFKGAEGVYNSADECFVASAYFKEAGFGVLASVPAPAQMIRKTLHYIAFGVVPLNFTAPTLGGFHDYMDELFEKIPHVLSTDPTFQGDSAEGKRLREERMPRT